MSVCAQSGQTEDDSGADEVTTAGATTTAAVRNKRPPSKMVRVLTVLAYLLSVSLAAILLSVYYVCVWKSPELPPLNDTGDLSAQRAHPRHYMHAETPFNLTGGGDSGVSAHTDPPTTEEAPVVTEASSEATVEAIVSTATPLNNSLYFDTNVTDTT